MRKLLGLILIFAVSLFGCKESDIEKSINDDYYVKYHFYADGYNYVYFDIIYLNSVTSNSNPAINTDSYKGYKSFENEKICGPFKKGDKVSIEMSNETGVVNRLLEIYVSKNNSPFALRKSTSSKKLEYTIDY